MKRKKGAMKERGTTLVHGWQWNWVKRGENRNAFQKASNLHNCKLLCTIISVVSDKWPKKSRFLFIDYTTIWNFTGTQWPLIMSCLKNKRQVLGVWQTKWVLYSEPIDRNHENVKNQALLHWCAKKIIQHECQRCSVKFRIADKRLKLWRAAFFRD